MRENETLIHFSIQITGGREAINQLLRMISKIAETKKVSSVYKINNNRQQDDFHGTMEGVLRATTHLDLPAFDRHINTLQADFSGESGTIRASINLLVYDKTISMLPQLTLPALSLFSNPLITRCAAEVWPEYEHPILAKSLSDLAKDTKFSASEFLWQGKSFIDF